MIRLVSIVQIVLVIGVWTSVLVGQDSSTEHRVRIEELTRRVNTLEQAKIEVRLAKIEESLASQHGMRYGELTLLTGLSVKELAVLVNRRRRRKEEEDDER